MIKQEQITVDQFNEMYKVGDPITYKDNDQEVTAAIRFPAEVLECKMEVVWVKGKNEAVQLNNVITK